MSKKLWQLGANDEVAQASDLPYALVTPGKWEVSDGSFRTISGPFEDNGAWFYTTDTYLSNVFNSESEAVAALTLTFTDPSEPSDSFTATRPSLPGHLCDRAVNKVEVADTTTLTLPSLVAGKSRDFYLKMTVTGSQQVTFSPSTGITYTGFGDPAKTYSAGTYVFHFTETSGNEFCVTDMLAEYDAVSGAIATISVSGELSSDQSVMINGSRRYGPTGRASTSSDFGFQPYVIPVFDGDTVSVDFSGYRGDSLVYKNGVLQMGSGSLPSTLTAGDAWLIVFATCLAYGTLVLMADGTLKRVEEVSVGDRVASVDPSSGKMSSDSVVDVSRGVGDARDDWTFDGGRTVSTVGRHRFWNVDLGEMLYLEAWNAGERARVFDGTAVKLVSRATSSGEFRHATIWTEKWNNYFANGLLAGNRNTVKGAY